MRGCSINFYTLVIVSGASKQAFSNPEEALMMVFGMRSIGMFSKFLFDLYYEPLLWFMILQNQGIYRIYNLNP